MRSRATDATEAAARLADMRESPDPNRRVLQLADILGKLVLDTPHDQATERAIDSLTLEFMARAGANPEPAVEAWRKIARAGGATPPGFLALAPGMARSHRRDPGADPGDPAAL